MARHQHTAERVVLVWIFVIMTGTSASEAASVLARGVRASDRRELLKIAAAISHLVKPLITAALR
jgi:hypothetical protein